LESSELIDSDDTDAIFCLEVSPSNLSPSIGILSTSVELFKGDDEGSGKSNLESVIDDADNGGEDLNAPSSE
jgi:hypothetical protein